MASGSGFFIVDENLEDEVVVKSDTDPNFWVVLESLAVAEKYIESGEAAKDLAAFGR